MKMYQDGIDFLNTYRPHTQRHRHLRTQLCLSPIRHMSPFKCVQEVLSRTFQKQNLFVETLIGTKQIHLHISACHIVYVITCFIYSAADNSIVINISIGIILQLVDCIRQRHTRISPAMAVEQRGIKPYLKCLQRSSARRDLSIEKLSGTWSFNSWLLITFCTSFSSKTIVMRQLNLSLVIVLHKYIFNSFQSYSFKRNWGLTKR